MKPINTRPPYLLPDNEPTHCNFYAWQGLPQGYEGCDTNATVYLTALQSDACRAWIKQHPRSIAFLPASQRLYLCDTHESLFTTMGVLLK